MKLASNAAIGSAFEELLKHLHHEYMIAGRALIEYNGVRAKVVKGAGGPGVLVADEDKSQPDFAGAVAPTGVFIGFDSKTTADDKGWYLGRKQRHQFIDLLRLSRFGAITFFLIESRPLRACFALRVHDDVFDEDELPKLRFDDAPSIEQIRARNGGRWVGPAPAKGPGKVTSVVIEERTGGSYDWLSIISEVWIHRSQNADGETE